MDSGTDGTTALSDEAEFDLDDVFPAGQFLACFSCYKAIIQLSDLTNIDGKPIHVCCKAKIEVQMKLKDVKDGAL